MILLRILIPTAGMINSVYESPKESRLEINDESAVRRNHDDGRGLTKLDSFLQIFCLLQGTCFFLFPGYLKDVGIAPGIFLGFAVTLAYLYLTSLYFWSDYQLRKFDPSTPENTSLFTLVEFVFIRIGKLPRLGWYLKLYLKYEIILSWLLGMSFSLLFICENFTLVLTIYFGYNVDKNTILMYLSFPLAFVCFTPNLAALNKAFYVSSLVVIVIMVETFFYIITDESPLPKMVFFGSFNAIPTYVNNIIFTIELTPLIFLYRKEMKREKDFTSLFGSLNLSISATILLCMIYSIFCNARYGNAIDGNIIQNLPNNFLTNACNIVMTITMILSGTVIFYGIFMSLWEGTLDTVFEGAENIKYYEYATKIILYIFIILMTAIAPSLSTFLNLLSSFSSPYDSILLPVALETIIVWKLSTSKLKKSLFVLKNTILAAFAVAIAVWSFTNAMLDFF